MKKLESVCYTTIFMVHELKKIQLLSLYMMYLRSLKIRQFETREQTAEFIQNINGMFDRLKTCNYKLIIKSTLDKKSFKA